MVQEINPFELARPAATGKPEEEIDPSGAKEVHPVTFGNSPRFGKDFRPVESQIEEEVPKGLSAPVSASTPVSVIGMEDLSETDPEQTVLQTAEKDTSATSDSGSLTSSKDVSTGSLAPPAGT